MERKEIMAGSCRISYLHREGRHPVVFLHGLGGTGNSWIKTARFLRPELELYFPDLPGHGRSCHRDGPYTVLSQAETVRDFIEALGLKRFTLVGNSYGGWISLKFSLELMQPDSLILVDSAGVNPTVGESSDEFREGFVDRVMSMSKFNDRKIIVDIIKNNSRQEEKIPESELVHIRCRTAVVWGVDDRLIPVKYAHLIHRMVSGSEIFLLDGIGHLPQIEGPERLAGIINAFLIPG